MPGHSSCTFSVFEVRAAFCGRAAVPQGTVSKVHASLQYRQVVFSKQQAGAPGLVHSVASVM